MKKIIESKISELVPDNLNANRGTEYGPYFMEKSFRANRDGRQKNNYRVRIVYCIRHTAFPHLSGQNILFVKPRVNPGFSFQALAKLSNIRWIFLGIAKEWN